MRDLRSLFVLTFAAGKLLHGSIEQAARDVVRSLARSGRDRRRAWHHRFILHVPGG
ncbi:hypothetical protein XFF6166_240045 [Xanthomonas citri pv. fuscans]|nr:hypothetical protein XFF6166_240045 [Xanthomonas citri pv. fuscans]SOO01947.1 hypothetical protein XFF6960_540045 [Xanthomonas citri pv. fuscans]SOO04609.1 hypothetical protein XFF7767_260043 [Xanthomonas citri pv. fuscans]SOO08017.1 hypothetical protein XFF6970_140039 [Xanthomonas citri pv. fuscans]SOO13753.1 hypothetical protein XFF7766_230040 [Xanthomonas citri pv. fuscans]